MATGGNITRAAKLFVSASTPDEMARAGRIYRAVTNLELYGVIDPNENTAGEGMIEHPSAAGQLFHAVTSWLKGQ